MAYSPDDPLYQLLMDEKIDDFNAARAGGKTVDLSGAILRGIDLRKLNADGLDLSNAYLRYADLRGIDFRNTQLEGASLCDAKISGAYFPKELKPEEIRLSIDRGIRMRYSS